MVSKQSRKILKDMLYLRPPPTDSSSGFLKFTKPRDLQTQAGQLIKTLLPSVSLNKDLQVPAQELYDSIMSRKERSNGHVIVALDASMDDIGARANFGRGNLDQESTAYDQFLMKFSNFQVNRHTQETIERCMIAGTIDIEDQVALCKDKNPSIPEQRDVLKKGVDTLYHRAKAIVKTIFDAEAKLHYMNGDHNNMAQIISGYFESRNVKPIVINFDFHSDARLKEDGPHSGSWLSEAYDRKEVAGTYIIGLNLLSNSEASIDNLDKFGVKYKEYTWQQIQQHGGSKKCISQIALEIISDIQKNYAQDYPVILTIDADTIEGMPTSAMQECLGYPVSDVYPMISDFIMNLNVECLNVAECKPSIDRTKGMMCGEFLSHCYYLQANCYLLKELQNKI